MIIEVDIRLGPRGSGETSTARVMNNEFKRVMVSVWRGLAICALVLSLGVHAQKTLRVDINGNTRADMRKEGWENWSFQGRGSASFDAIELTLRSTQEHLLLEGFSRKSLVANGLVMGADGVQVQGEGPVGMEIHLKGLSAGKHTLITYHHAPGPEQMLYQVSVGSGLQVVVRPSREASNDESLATAFLPFEVGESGEARMRVEALEGRRVLLNGLALDLSDPRFKALRPSPSDLERHANGDQGEVVLSWKAAEDAVSHQLCWSAGKDVTSALESLKLRPHRMEVQGHAQSIPVTRDSSLHYVWRVDTIGASGQITLGDVWRFRVRHPAFPQAEGYGRFAIGGRGGRVLHVTQLGDAGPGSLREAVEATGPRTVVFDVSGMITLQSKLIFREANSFLTLAGQTAPGKGICLRNYSFGGIGAKDTVVRYLRLRLGDLAGQTMDGMGLASSDHCIVDHCSISWTLDEAFSSRGAGNITFQRSLISEALNIAGHKKYPAGTAHGYAGSIGGDVGSFHHSLLAHNAGRNWSLAGSIDQANRHAGRLDVRNMVVYNWSHRTTDGGARQVQFVNNYYKPGPASKLWTYLNPQFENPAFGPQQYFIDGNVMEGVTGPEGPAGVLAGVKVQGQQPWPIRVEVPFFDPLVVTHSAQEAFENVLRDVGCNVPVLDDHDRRIIEETRSGGFTFRGSRSGLPGLPDSQADVGGWEDYPEIHRPNDWDTDRDGMPDHWEKTHGLNPEDPVDGTLDPDGDGYTHLEDYLNALTLGISDTQG